MQICLKLRRSAADKVYHRQHQQNKRQLAFLIFFPKTSTYTDCTVLHKVEELQPNYCLIVMELAGMNGLVNETHNSVLGRETTHF